MSASSSGRRIRTGLAIFATLLATLPLFLRVEAQKQRDRGAKAKSNPGGKSPAQNSVTDLPAKSKRFALIIGVDQYQDTQISRLSGAANDAKTLAETLVRYAGFPDDQVILLASDQPQERQPTRGNILQYLSNLRGLVPADGLLLVSFAGHGIERNGRGFLCPSDARLGAMALLEATAVSADTVREWIRETGVQQVLIIIDACRNDPSGRGAAENKLSDRFAKQFNFDVHNQEVTAFATLYATDVGQVAYEYKEKQRGYFSWWLVEGLKGGAANGRGEVTLGSLVKYLQEHVPKRVRLDLGPEKWQKPYAVVGGYRADDLVVSVAERARPNPSVASADPGANEREFWSSIKGSSDVEDFKAYLAQYPKGAFAALAKNRIKNLEAAAKPVAPGAGRRQAEPQTYTETVNRVGIEMVRVPAGKFMMGSPASETGRENDEGPQHEVSVSSFYMGKHEVTQLLWRAVSMLPKVKIDLPPNPAKFPGDQLPVEQVSWDEAVEFCARLSKATGKTYRLPTEAEWEYAARAMTTGPYAGPLDAMAWYESNSGGTTHPVGTKQPNGFGLYDMHGNVWEWCQDWYAENYYFKSPSAEPTGPGSGSNRVGRGGSWGSAPHLLRSATRGWEVPGYRDFYLGLRLARGPN